MPGASTINITGPSTINNTSSSNTSSENYTLIAAMVGAIGGIALIAVIYVAWRMICQTKVIPIQCSSTISWY
jgi:hypothetical protein